MNMSTPNKPSAFKTMPTPAKPFQRSNSSAFRIPRPVRGFAKSKQPVPVVEPIDVESSQETQAILADLAEVDEDEDSCTTTVEDDVLSEDRMTEAEFCDILFEFAQDNGVEVAKAFFNREMKKLQPQKKRKLESK